MTVLINILKIIGKVILWILAVILVLLLVFLICPVFYDFAVLRAAQLFFPPTYYVNAVFNVDYMILMPIYSIICLMLTALIRWIFKRY